MNERQAEAGVAMLSEYGIDASIQRGNPYEFGSDVVARYYIQVGGGFRVLWSSDDEPRFEYLSDLDGVVEFLDEVRKNGGKRQ